MRVYLRTFGCRANHADTEAVRAIITAAGHEVVGTSEGADAAVFNSCAVTAQAEADVRHAVRRAAREAPRLRTVVMGCVAGLDDRRPALAALPGVTHVVPGGDADAVARALGIDAVRPSAGARQQGTRALLRIQDGCDEHCTFCATTMARGANRSRPADELVREAARLAEHHPEIVLTGIHIGTYGVDLGTSLGALLERLVREVPLVRFRLSSVEATEVDDRIGALLTGGGDRVAPFLHSPLQSGSGRLLRRMGRHWYTPEQYAVRIERLTAGRPAFGLGADVITGFPGETDEDHARTVALCERLPFTYLHVFPFSGRPGTPAVRLPDPVAPPVARARAAELRLLAACKQTAYAASRAGARADVIVVGRGPDRSGLTEDYLTVRLADPTLPRGHRFVGRLGAGAGGSLVAAAHRYL
ncbi:MAG TPA: MiaB/RimO family radical SAM methylthiotransferase [Gemmatimonadaceae bacterium]|nr:MiaB/RimO family radical SAM methylthiotransferase [Gemmatimonadaceae bacterium]